MCFEVGDGDVGLRVEDLRSERDVGLYIERLPALGYRNIIHPNQVI